MSKSGAAASTRCLSQMARTTSRGARVSCHAEATRGVLKEREQGCLADRKDEASTLLTRDGGNACGECHGLAEGIGRHDRPGREAGATGK